MERRRRHGEHLHLVCQSNRVVLVCVLVHVSDQTWDSWRVLPGRTLHDLVAGEFGVELDQ